MKSFVFIFLALIGGIGAGVYASRAPLVSKTEYGYSKPYVGTYATNRAAEDNTPKQVERARVEVVGDDTFNFGIMSKDETRRHVFTVKNIGTAPLHIEFDSKSCRCTSVEIARPTVPPNSQTEIWIDWKPAKYDLEFRQAAIFRTNDPTRRELQFTIEGRVQQIVRHVPLALDFRNATRNTESVTNLDFYAYETDQLELTGIELLNSATAEFFEVKQTPMPTSKINAEPGAKSGATVTVTLKPGHPMGRISPQRIRVRTNIEEAEQFDVPIEGRIVSDIDVIGPGYDRDRQAFILGSLPGNASKEIQFWLLVKGDDHETIEIEPGVIDPADVLSVTVGERQLVGKVTRVPVKMTITPAKEGSVNRRGSGTGKVGTIELKTTRGDVQDGLTVYVSFSIDASTQ